MPVYPDMNINVNATNQPVSNLFLIIKSERLGYLLLILPIVVRDRVNLTVFNKIHDAKNIADIKT